MPDSKEKQTEPDRTTNEPVLPEEDTSKTAPSVEPQPEEEDEESKETVEDDSPSDDAELPAPSRQAKKARNREKAEKSRKLRAQQRKERKKTAEKDNTSDEALKESDKVGDEEETQKNSSPRRPSRKNRSQSAEDLPPKKAPRTPEAPGDLKKSRSSNKKTTKKIGAADAKSSMPRGILLHAAGDLLAASAIAVMGVLLLTGEPLPQDEFIIPFVLLFLCIPLTLLTGGIGLFLGKPWGRHVNGFIFHVIKLPFISQTCLTSLMQKETLAHLGLVRADFPEKLYYIIAAVGAGGFYLLFSQISP